MPAALLDRAAHRRPRLSRLASFATPVLLSLACALAACERGRTDAAQAQPTRAAAAPAATAKAMPFSVSGSIACEPGASTHAAREKGDALEADTPGWGFTRGRN